MTTSSTGTSQHINGVAERSQASLSEVCQQSFNRVQAFLTTKSADEKISSLQEQVKVSLRVIEEALERYNLEELSFSYNGGKDCLVLLILYLSALHSFAVRNATNSTSHTTHHEPFRIPHTLPAVYIISRHPFQEVDDFVDSSAKTYHLSLARYADSMKAAFAAYLHDFTNVKAIFVGTRRTDPHGAALQHFDPTDRGWPAFMRIHPVIDWHYVEVWTFIRALNVPYCSLYDMGYTSLGGTTDTYPNPKLKRSADAKDGQTAYRPAYELEDDDEERLGRPI